MARLGFMRAIATASVVLLLLSSVLGVTVTLYPIQDATVYSRSPNNANSLGSYLYVGNDASFGGQAQSLVKFSLTEIPVGATLNTVQLRLVNTDFSATTDVVIEVHEATTAWAEGTADITLEFTSDGKSGVPATANGGDPTWSHAAFNTRTWTSSTGPDASVSPVLVMTLSSVGTAPAPVGSLIPTVNNWINSPNSNYGFLLKGSGAYRRLGSRQNSQANQVALIIDYTPSGTTTPTPTPTPGGSTSAPSRAAGPVRNFIDFTKPAPGTDGAATGGGGLNAGAIAGIVVGVISVLIVVIRIVLICILR